MENEPVSYLFKIIIVGDSATGKTSLIRKYIDNKFETIHDLTIGVEFRSKIEKIIIDNQEIIVKFHIWDTAGQESFRSIINSYYRGVAGAILLFDVTDRSTFRNIPGWISELKNKSNDIKMPIVLIGNKTDLYERKISSKEAKLLADEYNIEYLENSCKNYSSTQIIFNTLIKKIVKRINNNSELPVGVRENGSTTTINLENKYYSENKCCIIN
jgi:Ras-related protein Rab-2A